MKHFGRYPPASKPGYPHRLTWAILVVFWLALSGVADAALRFVVLGDSQGFPINKVALHDINAQIVSLTPKPEFVLFLGDMVLWGGSTNFRDWQATMQTVAAAGIKLNMALGNHELYLSASPFFYLTAQQEFQQVFSDLPGNGPPGYERLVYSFESQDGASFFAVLDPFYVDPGTPVRTDDTPYIDAAQLNWLQEQINHTRAAHKFICLHPPAYSVYSGAIGSSFMTLWSLLDAHRFEMYFAGHEHLYSRKTIDRTVTPSWQNSVVQLINGTSGAPPDTGPVKVDPIAWHVNLGLYYYCVVDVSGPKIVAHSYGGNNGVYHLIDEFTLHAGALPGVNLLLTE